MTPSSGTISCERVGNTTGHQTNTASYYYSELYDECEERFLGNQVAFNSSTGQGGDSGSPWMEENEEDMVAIHWGVCDTPDTWFVDIGTAAWDGIIAVWGSIDQR